MIRGAVLIRGRTDSQSTPWNTGSCRPTPVPQSFPSVGRRKFAPFAFRQAATPNSLGPAVAPRRTQIGQIREILREAEQAAQCANRPRIVDRVQQIEKLEELAAEFDEHGTIQMAEFDQATARVG